jgi:hypothetical protein
MLGSVSLAIASASVVFPHCRGPKMATAGKSRISSLIREWSLRFKYVCILKL